MSHRNGPHIDIVHCTLHEDGWTVLRDGKPLGFYYTRRHARDFTTRHARRIVRARRIIVWNGKS